jgi:hypothetical protein
MPGHAVETDKQVLAYLWWRGRSFGCGGFNLGRFDVAFSLFTLGRVDMVPSVVA